MCLREYTYVRQHNISNHKNSIKNIENALAFANYSLEQSHYFNFNDVEILGSKNDFHKITKSHLFYYFSTGTYSNPVYNVVWRLDCEKSFCSVNVTLSLSNKY